MARELITTWGDYQIAIDRLLAMPAGRIRLYDEDLQQLNCDSPARLEALQRLLQTARRPDALQIAVRNAAPLRALHPRLLRLLAAYSHIAAARETPSQLAHLRDNLLLIDDRHALVRFDRDQPRAKLLIDEPDEVGGYLHRFDEIWAEGGEEISATTLGL